MKRQGPASPDMRVIKERVRRAPEGEAFAPVRPVFEDFHRLRMEGDYDYPLHQHTRYELIWVIQGPYHCDLNAEEVRLEDGEVLLIKPGDWHQDHLRDGQLHYVLHFRLASPEPVRTPVAVFREGVSAAGQICRGSLGSSLGLLDELRAEEAAADAYAGAAQDGLLLALFWRVLRKLPPESLSPALRQMSRDELERERILSVMREFLEESPGVEAIARGCGLSPRGLHNRCRKLFGQTPLKLLLDQKLRRADELMWVQGLRVQEVSDTLGFSNPFHFSRVYKKSRGHAPTRRSGSRVDTERAGADLKGGSSGILQNGAQGQDFALRDMDCQGGKP